MTDIRLQRHVPDGEKQNDTNEESGCESTMATFDSQSDLASVSNESTSDTS